MAARLGLAAQLIAAATQRGWCGRLGRTGVRCVVVNLREQYTFVWLNSTTFKDVANGFGGCWQKWPQQVGNLLQAASSICQNFLQVLGFFGLFSDLPRLYFFQVNIEVTHHRPNRIYGAVDTQIGHFFVVWAGIVFQMLPGLNSV